MGAPRCRKQHIVAELGAGGDGELDHARAAPMQGVHGCDGRVGVGTLQPVPVPPPGLGGITTDCGHHRSGGQQPQGLVRVVEGRHRGGEIHGSGHAAGSHVLDGGEVGQVDVAVDEGGHDVSP